MKPSEAAMVLGTAVLYDRRTVGQADAEAWAAALGDLPLEDCKQAVIRHYSSSADWLMPAHVKDGVRKIRAQRRADYGPLPLPPARIRDLDDGPEFNAAYAAWVKDSYRRIGDGLDPETDDPPELVQRPTAAVIETLRKQLTGKPAENQEEAS